MPAFNEGECIFENIRITRDVLAGAGITAEIVAVDDGSTDNTFSEIDRAAKIFEDVRTVRNPYNMGKGMALRNGFEHSTGEIVVFLDADLDLDPSQIQKLLSLLEEGPYDSVVTSKHHPNSKLDYPISRKISSWIYYIFIKTLFNLPVRDTQTGLKIFRRKVLDDVFHRLLVKKFAYDIELLAVAVRFGFSIKEVPVILSFKRDLKWGRIHLSDIMSLFIDTLAIFYRLRILHYYDMKRPPLPASNPKVLVVISGNEPSEDMVKRVAFDGDVRIACLSKNCGAENDKKESLFFSGRETLVKWLKSEGSDVEIIGFVSSECMPLGNWVKNAVRDFQDPWINAVCGPAIPGPFTAFPERISGMVFQTVIARGTDARLYSYKPMKMVKKGLADSVFLRASLYKDNLVEKSSIVWENGFIYDMSSSGQMRYDPDVAVSKPVPALILPYLKMVFRMGYREGYLFFGRYGSGNRFWEAFPIVMALIILAGWMVLPSWMYRGFAAFYTIIIFASGLFTFSLSSALPFMLGILLDHSVRAVAFPAGLLMKAKDIIFWRSNR
jgi:hypothetical protein